MSPPQSSALLAPQSSDPRGRNRRVTRCGIVERTVDADQAEVSGSEQEGQEHRRSRGLRTGLVEG